MSAPEPCVLGFRVKSGRAIAVLIGGPERSPRVLHRREVALADPKVPHSRQPYHASTSTLQKNAAVIRRLTGVVYRATELSFAGLMKDCRAAGHAPRAVALVVGSTVAPERIGNEHIRAHASEGRLFREALERAAGRRRLPCRVLRERDLAATARRELRLPGRSLAKVALDLGRGVGAPWRAEEKTAAVAAWLVLARRR